jgi:membrane protease subunit HflK
MAWNQPGGSNSPWGRRPGAPPGLDERVKEWQRWFESLFSPGGGEGSGSLVAIVIIVVVALWLASGFFQIKAAERGVIQRFGRLIHVRGQGWGWRWPWPIETLTKVNVANVNSSDYKSRVLTADVNLVELRFAVQYQYTDPVKVLFKVADPEATLRGVSESAFRQIVGQSPLDDVLVGATRPHITQRTKELIQHTLDFYNAGITVTSVNLTDVQVPDPVIPSQRDANKALADQERFVKEAQAYANGVIPVAQGGASRLQQDAAGYHAQVVALAEGQASRFTQLADAYAQAPEVTRKRLYLETIETILGRSHKVLLDAKAGSGNGNLIYLPLDKLLEHAASKELEPGTEAVPRASQSGDPDAASVDNRGRTER